MINNINEKLIEKLLHLKSDKLKATIGPPKKDEGQEGDVTIRRVENKLGLYGKFKNTWYKFAETDANSELKEVPELAGQLSAGLKPDHSSGWRAIQGDTLTITGQHLFGSIPSLYQLWYSPTSTFSKVYSISSHHQAGEDDSDEPGMCGIELTKVSYVLRRNTINDDSPWGWYWPDGEAEGTKIGGNAGSDLGYLKINLWK